MASFILIKMGIRLRSLGIFIVSSVMGTLYAVLVALVSSHLRAGFIAWPVWIGLFWLLFTKFRLLHFAGYIAVLPVSLLAFEVFWHAARPGVVADRHITVDRSHITPNIRAINADAKNAVPEGFGWGMGEVLIGKDGFRADPETGEGNPHRCKFALVSDSMIYGSGLPYRQTLGPILRNLGLHACIFGVSGNGSIDYLATLKFVADRIEPGAHVAVYLYAYNDFVSLHKYFRRGFLSLYRWFPTLFDWSVDFDTWRRTTFTYKLFRGEREEPRTRLWQYELGKGPPVKLLYPHDPVAYVSPRSLNGSQRLALAFFFNNLDDLARRRAWRVYVIIHPDFTEIFANLARGSKVFVDLDPRRAAGLRACKEFWFVCEDISRYLYDRSLSASANPYFLDNRHFSAFGTRIIAEHYATLIKKGP